MWWLPLPHSCKQIGLSTWSIYSAAEVTTLWRYANLFIIIVINISTDTYAQTYGRRLPNWRSVGGPSGDQLCCLLVRLCRDCLLLLAQKAWLVVTYVLHKSCKHFDQMKIARLLHLIQYKFAVPSLPALGPWAPRSRTGRLARKYLPGFPYNWSLRSEINSTLD